MGEWDTAYSVITTLASGDDFLVRQLSATPPAAGTIRRITSANLAAALASLSASLVAVPVSGDTTGVTDTAAINAVAQAGKLAWLMPGTYYIKNLLPDSYGGIVGSGAATILKVVAGTTGYAIALKTPATTAQVTLAGFRLNCNQVCGGIQLDNTGFNTVTSFVPYDPLHQCRDVFVLAANGDAWHLDNNARGLSFANCKQYFASGYGWYLGPGAGSSGAGCTDSNFTGCVTGNSGNHGVFIAAGSSNNMLDSFKAFWAGYSEASASWVSSTACGIEVQGNNNKIVSCDAQQNALHGIELQNCDANTVTGNTADTNGANSAVGAGLSVSAATNCSAGLNAGNNNSGLSPGSQLYGYQVGGNCTGTLLYANSVYGTGGGFHYVSGGFGFQILDQLTTGLWSSNIAQFPSPTYSTYGTTQALSNGSTIVNGVPSTGSNFAVYPVSSTANVTGVILAAPPNGAGTRITVVNTTAFTVTFAASGTSNVADGVSDVIPALTSRTFTYNGSLWYRAA